MVLHARNLKLNRDLSKQLVYELAKLHN